MQKVLSRKVSPNLGNGGGCEGETLNGFIIKAIDEAHGADGTEMKQPPVAFMEFMKGKRVA